MSSIEAKNLDAPNGTSSKEKSPLRSRNDLVIELSDGGLADDEDGCLDSEELDFDFDPDEFYGSEVDYGNVGISQLDRKNAIPNGLEFTKKEIVVNNAGRALRHVHLGILNMPNLDTVSKAISKEPGLTDEINHFFHKCILALTPIPSTVQDVDLFIEDVKKFKAANTSCAVSASWLFDGKLVLMERPGNRWKPDRTGTRCTVVHGEETIDIRAEIRNPLDIDLPLEERTPFYKVCALIDRNRVAGIYDKNSDTTSIPFDKENIERIWLEKNTVQDGHPHLEKTYVKITETIFDRINIAAAQNLNGSLGPFLAAIFLFKDGRTVQISSVHELGFFTEPKQWSKAKIDPKLLPTPTFSELERKLQFIKYGCQDEIKTAIDAACTKALQRLNVALDTPIAGRMKHIAVRLATKEVDGKTYEEALDRLRYRSSDEVPFEQSLLAEAAGLSHEILVRHDFEVKEPVDSPTDVASQLPSSLRKDRASIVKRIKESLPDEFGQAYVDRAHKKMVDSEIAPPWMGMFWNDESVAEGCSSFPLCLEDRLSGVLVQRIHNLPVDYIVNHALSLRPDVSDLLRRWQTAWEKSFPNFETNPYYEKARTKNSMTNWAIGQIDWRMKRFKKDLDSFFSRQESDSQLNPLAIKLELVDQMDGYMEFAKDDPRDHRLHVVDDADTVLACAEMLPNSVVLVWRNDAFLFVGNGEDGLPRFTYIGPTRKWMNQRLNDNPKYWSWEPFQKYMKRRSVTAKNRRIAAALLADMAWQGEQKAFIKATAMKAGTWTIDLSNVRTISDAEAKLCMLSHDAECLVQEHLPFTHEQRYYIHGGRVFTSVCSDRNFCRVDGREGKRLDDRLAVLKVPSIDNGPFDRGVTTHVVDRGTSAKLAKMARKIARELKQYGILNYCLDLGLTDRGIAAVEVNTLHFAGPYCMDHRWQAKTYTKERKREIERTLELLKCESYGYRIDEETRSRVLRSIGTYDLLDMERSAVLNGGWFNLRKRVKSALLRVLFELAVEKDEKNWLDVLGKLTDEAA